MRQSDFWQAIRVSPFARLQFPFPFGACQTSQVCRYYLCTLATLY